MLTHCDFVYADESAKFQMPFNLALVPEFGSSYSIPARLGYLRAAELIQLGQSFDAHCAAELRLVTRVVPDQELLPTAMATANSAETHIHFREPRSSVSLILRRRFGKPPPRQIWCGCFYNGLCNRRAPESKRWFLNVHTLVRNCFVTRDSQTA